MIFSIHQPNYIPWIGYFYKIYKSDVFIYLDNVQYPRGQSFGARNRVNTSNGPLFLTIPVTIEKGNEGKVTYMDVQYSDPKWRVKHLRTIEANYKKAPFFKEVYPLLQSVIEQDLSFVENNIQIIEAVCAYLGINTERKRLSALLDEYGQKTNLIADIARVIGADAYLSGDGGGTEYTDEAFLEEQGIRLDFTGFIHPVYEQLWTREFHPYMSVIDLLFNKGRDSMNVVLSANGISA